MILKGLVDYATGIRRRNGWFGARRGKKRSACGLRPLIKTSGRGLAGCFWGGKGRRKRLPHLVHLLYIWLHAVFGVRRQLFLRIDDNYFCRSCCLTRKCYRILDVVARRRGAPQWAGAIARRCCVLDWRNRASGRWESGKPAFGFPLFHPPSPPELWKCGNRAAFWRDFQGARGKSGKPVFGFPRFPQFRHFHSSALAFVRGGAPGTSREVCGASSRCRQPASGRRARFPGTVPVRTPRSCLGFLP